MPGTAIVTIGEGEWSVDVATTSAELIQGLSGIASILSGTGMLFVLPARQVATIQTNEMLFPIDIIFIKDDTVLSIANNISPGYLVEEATPCDMFLEVNAGEAALVEVGAVVSTVITQEPVANNFSGIIAFVLPLAILAFIVGMLPRGSSHSSNPSRQLGEPKTDVERKETHYAKYGTKELPERGKGREEVTVRCSICGEEIKVPLGITRSEALRKHLEEKHGHQSSGTEYYWEITDVETGEIMQKRTPYASISKVYRSARDYQRRRSGKDKEHLVVIRIYDTPVMEEWGKTIKYVLESGMHRGIPILIGKTPLQEEALDRLWPYGILEVHDDGDLTIMSAGKKYVVTTDGGVFAEEDIIPATGHMIEIPLTKPPLPSSSREQIERMAKEGYEWSAVDDWVTRQVGYDKEALDWAREIYNKAKLEEQHSISGEPRRRLVEEHGSWAVGRAEAICPEGDIACVTREAKRLIETLRTRYGEVPVRYVTIVNSGATVFHPGDTVSIVALERENRRVGELGEKEATYK